MRMGEFMTIGPATVGEGDVAGFDIEGAKIGVARVGGSLYAFSAVCTHQGCLVNEVTDGKIVCPCHGSMFSIADGSVLGGPAPKPLPEANVTVEGGKVVVAPT